MVEVVHLIRYTNFKIYRLNYVRLHTCELQILDTAKNGSKLTPKSGKSVYR